MKSRSLGDILSKVSGREGVKMNPSGVSQYDDQKTVFRELNRDHVCAFGYVDKAGIPFGGQSGDRLT